MSRLGRTNEVVEGNVETLPHLEELCGHAIAIGLGLLAKLARLAKHVLRVLIVAHDEMGIDAAQPLVARDHIRGDLLVRRPEMRAAVHIINGGRQIEARHGIQSLI